MGKIFCIFGKSSSGKDTIYKRLLAENRYQLVPVIPYTTRPVRRGETEGVEYHFVCDEKADTLEKEGKIIELRAYHTVHGIWKYFTADDGQIDLEKEENYLVIGTLEAFLKFRSYFGEEAVVPIYIMSDDGVRLERALIRERKQVQPKYAEMCRRFLADEQDFSEENLTRAGIEKRFVNIELDALQAEIEEYIGKFC